MPDTPHHDEIRHRASELAAVVRELGGRGLAPGTGGNFSLRLGRDPLRLLMTPSGADKGRVQAEELLVVDAAGRPDPELSLGGGKPSAETLLHCTLIEHAGAGSVLHTHSPDNTLLGEHFLPRGGFFIEGYEMLKGIQGVTTHEASVFVPVLANSQDMGVLAGQILDLLGRHPEVRGLLLAGHGLYTWGETLAEARRHVEVFEFLFEVVGRRTAWRAFDGRPAGGEG